MVWHPWEPARLYTFAGPLPYLCLPGRPFLGSPIPFCFDPANVANNLSNKICTWNTRSYTTSCLLLLHAECIFIQFFWGSVPPKRPSHRHRKTFPVFGDKVRQWNEFVSGRDGNVRWFPFGPRNLWPTISWIGTENYVC